MTKSNGREFFYSIEVTTCCRKCQDQHFASMFVGFLALAVGFDGIVEVSASFAIGILPLRLQPKCGNVVPPAQGLVVLLIVCR